MSGILQHYSWFCVVAGDYAGFPGCGLLRLHSTYRHDLKIYASDEGRVQMTAAAFAKVNRQDILGVATVVFSEINVIIQTNCMYIYLMS